MSGLGILRTENDINAIIGSGKPYQIAHIQRGIFGTTARREKVGQECRLCC